MRKTEIIKKREKHEKREIERKMRSKKRERK